MSAVYGKACEGGTYKSLFDRFYEPSKPAGYNKVAEWLLNCILRGSRKRTTKADEQREGIVHSNWKWCFLKETNAYV